MGNKKLSADENNFDFHKEKCLVLIKLDKLAVKLSGLGFLNFSFNFASFCSTFLHQTGIFCPIFNSFVLLRLFLLHLPLHFQSAGHFLILVLAESIFGSTMCIFVVTKSLPRPNQSLRFSGTFSKYQNIFTKFHIAVTLHYSPSWHSALECRLVKHWNENLDLCIQLLVLQLLFFSL